MPCPSPSPHPDDHGFGGCERRIVAALSAEPTHVNRLIETLGAPAPMVLAALQSLVTDGVVALDGSTAVLGQPALPGMDHRAVESLTHRDFVSAALVYRSPWIPRAPADRWYGASDHRSHRRR
ncbi:MAG: hypothetical protein R2706_04145 [Acidimicrobiales bacterium]